MVTFDFIMDAPALEKAFNDLLALIPLAKSSDVLEEIATSIDLDVTAVVGNRSRLLRNVLLYLNSEEFDAEATREQLIAINLMRMRTHLGFDAVQEEQNQDPDEEQREEEKVAEVTDMVAALEKVEKQAGRKMGVTIKAEDKNSESEEESDDDFFQDAPTNPLPVMEDTKAAAWKIGKIKDFRIDGVIGGTGGKKLTYSSLRHQVKSAVSRGFEEAEICEAVIRCISPQDSTREYLEGIRKITLKKVMSTMRAYFCEGDVTSTYNAMIHAKQGSGPLDTPMKFITDMFVLRDRVLNLSKAQRNRDSQYSEPLVQSEMQRSIYNGLKDEFIRQDLKVLLKKKGLDDDELLGELNLAMRSKKEHEDKFLEPSTRRRANASVISTDDDAMVHREDHNCKNCSQNNSNPNNNPKSESNAKNNGTTNNNPNPNNSHNNKNRNNNHANNSNSGNSNNSFQNSSDSSYNSAVCPPNMDPFLAQIRSVVGAAVQPLQTQINHLYQIQSVGFPTPPQFPYVKRGNGQVGRGGAGRGGPGNLIAPGSNATYVLGEAVGQAAAAVTGGGNADNGDGMEGTNADPGIIHQVGTPTDDYLTQIMSHLHTYGGWNSRGGYAGRGRGNRGNRGNRGYWGGNRNPSRNFKCAICRAANAVACNHCLICHEVDHLRENCPHLNDDGYIPKN